jgi:hypothetical protein
MATQEPAEQLRLSEMMLRIENACVILPLMGVDTMQIAALYAGLGNHDIAHAIH